MNLDEFMKEEEIIREKTIKIADYIIDNNSSLRKATMYFNSLVEKKEQISHVTVSHYMNEKLKEFDLKRYNKVQEIINKNNSHNIDNDQVRKRVLTTSFLLVYDKLTIEEIVDKLTQLKIETSYFIAYRDLTVRLKKIAEKEDSKEFSLLYDEVKCLLEKHRLDNLEQRKRK